MNSHILKKESLSKKFKCYFLSKAHRRKRSTHKREELLEAESWHFKRAKSSVGSYL